MNDNWDDYLIFFQKNLIYFIPKIYLDNLKKNYFSSKNKAHDDDDDDDDGVDA